MTNFIFFNNSPVILVVKDENLEKDGSASKDDVTCQPAHRPKAHNQLVQEKRAKPGRARVTHLPTSGEEKPSMGRRMRQLRLMQDATQSEWAKILGTSQSAISMMERDLKPIPIAVYKRLCELQVHHPWPSYELCLQRYATSAQKKLDLR